MGYTSASFDVTASVLYVDQYYETGLQDVIIYANNSSGSASYAPVPSATYAAYVQAVDPFFQSNTLIVFTPPPTFTPTPTVTPQEPFAPITISGERGIFEIPINTGNTKPNKRAIKVVSF